MLHCLELWKSWKQNYSGNGDCLIKRYFLISKLSKYVRKNVRCFKISRLEYPLNQHFINFR